MSEQGEQQPPGNALLTAVSTVSGSCARICGADGASVALLTQGRLGPLYATDARGAALEEAQVVLGEGPCIDVVSSRAPVLVADLEDPVEAATRLWPGFMAEVAPLDVRALFAFPVRIGAILLGTFELYRASPGALTGAQLGAALSSVDVLAGSLLGSGDERAPQEASLLPVVHQAAGMITVQMDITIEEAVLRLRAAAFSAGRLVNDLADDVVARRVRFEEER